MDLPTAPAVMVAEEIVVEGADVAEAQLEAVICRHLGLPLPEPEKSDSGSAYSANNVNLAGRRRVDRPRKAFGGIGILPVWPLGWKTCAILMTATGLTPAA